MPGWEKSALTTLVCQIMQLDEEKLKNKDELLSSIYQMALQRYSRDFADRTSVTTSGDGTKQYSLPSDWVDDFSVVLSLEFPAGEDTPVFLEDDDFKLLTNVKTDLRLFFITRTPQTTDTYTLEYTKMQLLTTIPDRHKEAFAYLCAALLTESVASSDTNLQDSTLSADTIDNDNISKEWRTQSDRFFKRYNEIVGPKESGTLLAGFADTELDSDFAGVVPRVVHPR